LSRKTVGTLPVVVSASVETGTPVAALTAERKLPSTTGSDAETSDAESDAAAAAIHALDVMVDAVAFATASESGTTSRKAMVATSAPSPAARRRAPSPPPSPPPAAARRRSTGADPLLAARATHATLGSAVPPKVGALAHDVSSAGELSAAPMPSETSRPAESSRTPEMRMRDAHAAIESQPSASSVAGPAAVAAPQRSCAPTTELSAVRAGTPAPTDTCHVTTADGIAVVEAVGVGAAEADVASDDAGDALVELDTVTAKAGVVEYVAVAAPLALCVPDAALLSLGEPEKDAEGDGAPLVVASPRDADGDGEIDLEYVDEAVPVVESVLVTDMVVERERDGEPVAERERVSVTEAVLHGVAERERDGEPLKETVADEQPDADTLPERDVVVRAVDDALGERDGDDDGEMVGDVERERDGDVDAVEHGDAEREREGDDETVEHGDAERERVTVTDADGQRETLPVREPVGEDVLDNDVVRVMDGEGDAEGDAETVGETPAEALCDVERVSVGDDVVEPVGAARVAVPRGDTVLVAVDVGEPEPVPVLVDEPVPEPVPVDVDEPVPEPVPVDVDEPVPVPVPVDELEIDLEMDVEKVWVPLTDGE
jgi:hypothetical protein